MNDFRRLKEEADIAAVVEALGIETTKRGSAYFILCPRPEHNDHRATNCYFKPGWNAVVCKVCGRKIQAIDLIMYTTGLDYGQAADMLWRIEGCPNWYYDKKRGAACPSPSISSKELAFLGIRLHGEVKTPLRFYQHKPFLCNEIPKDCVMSAHDLGYLLQRREASSWTISQNDLNQLVRSECVKKERELNEIADVCCHWTDKPLLVKERTLLDSIKTKGGPLCD